MKTEEVPQLPSKRTLSASALKRRWDWRARMRQCGAWLWQFGLSPSTVRAIDLRAILKTLRAASRRKPALRQMGIDEIYLGKKQSAFSDRGPAIWRRAKEPLWFGPESAKKETLDEFFQEHLSAFQRRVIQAACVDMCGAVPPEPGSNGCRTARSSMTSSTFCSTRRPRWDEVRRAEFFRKGGRAREIVKGKRWLLLKAVG